MQLAYKGYQIRTSINADYSNPVASVYLITPRRAVKVFKTTSLDLATKWIDAYRAGEHWAVEARLRSNANV